MNLSIITTADGSKTIWNEQVGEHYHSRNGALQESRHVFLDAGLKYFLSNKDLKEVSVLEVGFGTGLNFLLSAGYCTTNQIQLNYTGIEAYPLTAEMILQTGYEHYIQPDIWSNFLDKYPLSINHIVAINSKVNLSLAHTKLQSYHSTVLFDVIYFDAFAVARQPEMWDEEAIRHTINFLKPGGVFVTYAITGNLKRILKALGLTIEKIPGAAGKREMLRATLVHRP